MKRDPKGSMLYWNTWIDFHEKNLDKMLVQANEPFPNSEYLPQFLFEIAKKIADLMFYRYSRGDDIDLLSKRFDILLDAWEKSVALGSDVWDEDTRLIRNSWELNIDFYSYCFRLIALSMLLNLPDPQWQRLINLVGNEGEDAVLDRIINHKSPGRVIGSKVCFPKTYSSLLNVMIKRDESQSLGLKNFLSGWFLSLRDAGPKSVPPAHRTPYWWKSCADESLGMQGSYHGCWCVEAAIVAKICQIDDSACIEMPFYPADLVSDGRSPRYPDTPSPFEPKKDTKKNGFLGLEGIFRFLRK
ncbi:PoNe immunity protein domain-containing protein [Xanthomonas pisi]|nr:PoNe immunity protein domain-containing protein [Xanthomonas pisi]